ncbi:hypothetical protein NQ042_09035 [Corynebacterium phoceense]|uniref:hypothetical protein n=1 Tax=Corynebacterium phoceense TaxID=1686286 RepID=UPI001E136202|nr:hypothetical protein [Corynebacterium phoceense]MCQ9334225.1 hypothetical protein [Corynebacterium phoceense]MCQ9337057.1 hypothetical protein [Corynebacterium phoceense]HJG43993.1 hypothetical protein [Corynebacterium phoceense]
MSSKEPRKRQKIKVKWWHILLIAFFVVTFLFLAWWQWTRFQSGSGTFQNLGYAFQWPLFAVFVVYAYRTALKYENERIDAENAAAADGDENYQYVSEREAPKHTMTAIDEDFLPSRPRMDVEEFNALNVQRREHPSTRNESESND